MNAQTLNSDSVRTDSIPVEGSVHWVYLPDTALLLNGDKITGRILSFEQGRLSIDGQVPGVIFLKWHKLITISGGSRQFKVEDVNGIAYIGYILHSPDTGELLIKGQLTYGVRLEDIVRIYPLEEKWYRGIKGDLGAGLNFAKSSEVLTMNADYNLYYVVEGWRFLHNLSYVATSTEDEQTSIRIDANFQELYALPNRWVASEINSFNRNDELGIKARLSFGLGIGNNIVQTEIQRLLLLTGAVMNLERDIESRTLTTNYEWPLSLNHTIYSFIRPDLSTTTKVAYFLGITDKGRQRLDASTDIAWEFIPNLKFKVSFYYNFDNKNLEGKTTKEDYGTVLSLSIQLK